MTGGTKTVKIQGDEVMMKDQSYFKQCTGDEAATRSFGMGVVSHSITGKTYFVSWSMDVEVEGQNVVRHLDVSTSNHASEIGNESVPWTELAEAAFEPGGKCAGMDALKLQRYDRPCPPAPDGEAQTGHHLIPGRCMRNVGDYSHGKAPVICVSQGNQHQGSHKLCHSKFDHIELEHFTEGKDFTYGNARDTAAASAGGALSPPRELSKEEKGCVAFQLDTYYRSDPPAGPGCCEGDSVRASGAPGKVAAPSTTPAVTF
jgi:hypothetical protein